MKFRILPLCLAFAAFGLGANSPAHAIGCISGGVAGAVAGHMAHHGVLGAIGGCIAGHEYNKHQQNAATRAQSNQNDQPPANNNTQYNNTQ